MRSYAVIPPLMLDAAQRRCVFYNENGALQDMEADFKVKILKFVTRTELVECEPVVPFCFVGAEKFKCLDGW